MSQRSEKYARNMERRVGKLERTVEQITTEQVRQGSHISVLEDDLAVYRAAVAERDLREARRKTQEQRQQRREAEATRRKNARTLAMLAVLVALAVVLLALIGCRVSAAERDKQAAAASSASAVVISAEIVPYLWVRSNHNVTVCIFAFAPRNCTVNLLNGSMNNSSFIRIHRLKV